MGIGPGIGARAKSDGTVEIIIHDDGKELCGVSMPYTNAVAAGVTILATAATAAKAAGAEPTIGNSLDGVLGLRVSGIGLGAGPATEPPVLVVHIGAARFGISLEGMSLTDFAHSLLTASASQGRPQ